MKFRTVLRHPLRDDLARNGQLLPGNAFGLVVSEEPDGSWPAGTLRKMARPKEYPVICIHGGSAWLCRGCAAELLAGG